MPVLCGQVVIAPKPPQPLDKGLPGAGLLAHIAVDKYLDHIPLHRTQQRLERLGCCCRVRCCATGWRPVPNF